MDLQQKIVCSFLWFCLLAGAFGCSDDDASGQTDGGLSGNKKELVLRSFSGWLPGDTTFFPDSVFFAKGNKSGNYKEVWKACVERNGRTALSGTKYYPSDNSTVYLRGFAPEGKLGARMTVGYRIDGRQDILVTDEQEGRLTDMFWQEQKTFEFSHLLTQLRFRLRIDAKGMAHGWKLRGIAVDSMQQDVALSLTDKSLLFSGESGRIVAADRSGNRLLPLDTTWVEIPEAVMVQPAVPLYLAVMLEDSLASRKQYERLPVVFDEKDGCSVPGTSYLLSVTVRAEGNVALSASVAEWKKGNNGVGHIH